MFGRAIVIYGFFIFVDRPDVGCRLTSAADSVGLKGCTRMMARRRRRRRPRQCHGLAAVVGIVRAVGARAERRRRQ